MNHNIEAKKATLENVHTCKVFFYCVEEYQALMVCIAEGLKELGIPFYSNINHWKISPETEEYLFRHVSGVTPDDCSVVVLGNNWFIKNQGFPENLFHPTRKYITVYLDEMDGPRWSLFLHEGWKFFDFVFRTHCNSTTQYPQNFIPWGFGLSKRIIRETCESINFQERRRALLVNFRVDQKKLIIRKWHQKTDRGTLVAEKGFILADYPLRPLMSEQFVPQIHEIMPVDNTVDNFNHPPSDSYHYLQWTQTGQRHYPSYYKRLKEVAACASFAGWMIPSSDSGEPFVEWWDSWRFWESLAAGCVTFHVDFDKYGIKLPVMPENWRHYIGIDLDNMQSAVDRIASDPGILERISQEGRQWVIAHYSPVPTALRFLKTLGFQGLDEFLPFELLDINLIIFPDWSLWEDALHRELSAVLTALMTHSEKNRMSLLIDTSDISEQEADLLLSSVVMDILMSQDLEVTDGLNISLVGTLSAGQWEVLRLHLQARIVLDKENQEAIALAGAENLPLFPLDRPDH